MKRSLRPPDRENRETHESRGGDPSGKREHPAHGFPARTAEQQSVDEGQRRGDTLAESGQRKKEHSGKLQREKHSGRGAKDNDQE